MWITEEKTGIIKIKEYGQEIFVHERYCNIQFCKTYCGAKTNARTNFSVYIYCMYEYIKREICGPYA